MNSFQAKIETAKGMREEEKLYRYNGVLYPVIISPEQNLRALETVEARSDDVLLVAYPKCGFVGGAIGKALDRKIAGSNLTTTSTTTKLPLGGPMRFNWMVAILRQIITASTGEKQESKLPPLLEIFGPEMLQLLHEAPSPRLLGTHMHPDNIPPSFYRKKTKMLVVFRNPKDTSVSFYHFSNKNPVLPAAGAWDRFFLDFMSGEVPWGSYFDHALAWEKRMDQSNVMIITFEELKQDLRGSIQTVAEFFGFKLTEAQIQTIEEESTFDTMKKRSAESHGRMGNVFFRKGEVGDWRNHFSPAQSEQMNAAFEKHLGGTNLGARLNYDAYCK